MQLKCELAKDQTGMLLVYQKELSDLKNMHRSEIERIKDDHRRKTDCRTFSFKPIKSKITSSNSFKMLPNISIIKLHC